MSRQTNKQDVINLCESYGIPTVDIDGTQLPLDALETALSAVLSAVLPDGRSEKS